MESGRSALQTSTPPRMRAALAPWREPARQSGGRWPKPWRLPRPQPGRGGRQTPQPQTWRKRHCRLRCKRQRREREGEDGARVSERHRRRGSAAGSAGALPHPWRAREQRQTRRRLRRSRPWPRRRSWPRRGCAYRLQRQEAEGQRLAEGRTSERRAGERGRAAGKQAAGKQVVQQRRPASRAPSAAATLMAVAWPPLVASARALLNASEVPPCRGGRREKRGGGDLSVGGRRWRASGSGFGARWGLGGRPGGLALAALAFETPFAKASPPRLAMAFTCRSR